MTSLRFLWAVKGAPYAPFPEIWKWRVAPRIGRKPEVRLEMQKPEGAVQPITLWSRKNEKNVYEHNHIEDGHCIPGTERQAPKTDAHKSAWNKGQWLYEHAWLDGSVPPKVLHDQQEQLPVMRAVSVEIRNTSRSEHEESMNIKFTHQHH